MSFANTRGADLHDCSFADIQGHQNNLTANTTSSYHNLFLVHNDTTYRIEGNHITYGLPDPVISPALSASRMVCVSPPSSLHSIFPDADRADLNAVVAHTLHPCDLRKLDPRCHHHIQLCHGCIPPRPFFVTPSNSVEDYSSLDTVLVPLQIYFGILIARVPPSSAPSVTRNFQRYTARLIALADRYPWPAVRAYHMSFHQRRCVEMYTRGDYSGWGREDGELVEEHLLEHRSRAPRSSSVRRYKEKQD